MSLSLPGAPGISLGRRSMSRDGRRAARRVGPAPEPSVARNGGKLDELADALAQIKMATGLSDLEVATRLVEPLDPTSPLRPIDVFAAGRADLVTAYLDGTLDAAGLLSAWQRS